MMSDQVDEAFARIGCYGIAVWLIEFLAKLKLDLSSDFAPGAAYETPRRSGLKASLSRPAGVKPARPGPFEDIVLSRLEGSDDAAMPLGLDPLTETPDSARRKIASATDGGSHRDPLSGTTRISYFIPDGRIIELRFRPELVGFDRYVLARLGTAIDLSPS